MDSLALSSAGWEVVADTRMNEREMLFKLMPQIKNALPQLSGVKSCAMIGCGTGALELEFVGVDGFCPNVTEIAAVDPDEDQMAQLKTRIAQLLPTVNVNFYQETAQDWKGAGKLFDAVLIFQFLYYVSMSERPAVFKKLFDNVVASGGYVILYIHCQQWMSNPVGIQAKIANRMITRLGLPPFDETDMARISEMMTSAGFSLCYEQAVDCEYRVEPMDDEFLSSFVIWSGGTLSLERVREVATEEYGDRKVVPYTMTFAVFRKPWFDRNRIRRTGI